MSIINVGINYALSKRIYELINPTPEITYIILNRDMINPNLLLSESSSVKCSSSSYFFYFSKFKTY
jgi:hypothetical protein